MIEVTTIGLVSLGVALLFVGATLSSYAAGVLGLLIGGTGGYLVGPSIAGVAGMATAPTTAVAALVAGLAGAALTILLLKTAVAAIAFVVGTYAGWSALAALLVDSALLEIPVALGIGVVAAAIAYVMTQTMLVILTSFVGAAFASRVVTVADLVGAQGALDPRLLLFDVSEPLFVTLFALGVLSQFGLIKLGYATKLLGRMPGLRPVRNRRRT